MGNASERHQTIWSIYDSIEATRNWKALLLFAVTMAVATLCAYAFAQIDGVRNFMGFWTKVGLALGLLISIYGVSGVGIMLYDAATYKVETGPATALIRSFGTSHNLLVVLLAGLLLFLIIIFCCMMLLMMGKIPGVGELLAFALSPVSVIVIGSSFFALLYVLFPFAAVAAWSGEGTLRTFAILLAIFRKRFMTVVVQEVFLSIAVLLVGGLVFFMFITGTGMVAAISPSLFEGPDPFLGMRGMGGMGGPRGMDFGVSGLLGLLFGGGMLGGVSKSALAGASGITLLSCLAALIPSLIWLQGICTIYNSTLVGLDLSEAENKLMDGLSVAKKKLADARQAASEAAAAAKRNQTAAPASARCDSCGSVLSPGDAFCGECGGRVAR